MSLHHYLAVTKQSCPPMLQKAKRLTLPLLDPSVLSLPQLWALHEQALHKIQDSRFRIHKNCPTSPAPALSLLDLKLELTRRLMQSCNLCPWLCGVNRMNGEKGRCGLGRSAKVFREGLLAGEELFVIPTHELFVTGCNMRCQFCQSWEGITKTEKGTPLTPSAFLRLAHRRFAQGAINVHFVGGEPTVNLLAILECLKEIDLPLPVVWNTNLWVTDEALDLLHGVVDLFLADFKFGNDECAKTVGGVEGYVSVLERNLLRAKGMASLVVRHLVMPGHLECCLEQVAAWVFEHMPDVPFHLMLQYTPDWRACDDPVLGRFLSEAEQQKALALARSYRLNLVA